MNVLLESLAEYIFETVVHVVSLNRDVASDVYDAPRDTSEFFTAYWWTLFSCSGYCRYLQYQR